MLLGEKERMLQETEKDREVWRRRDQALAAVLKEKETLLHCLKVELESCQRDVQVSNNESLAQQKPSSL